MTDLTGTVLAFTPLQPDGKAVAEFLANIAGNGTTVLVKHGPYDPAPSGDRCAQTLNGSGLIADWANEHGRTKNLYFVLNEPRERPWAGQGGIPKEEDIARIRGIMIDIDPDRGVLATSGGFDKERARLARFAHGLPTGPCPPTFIVDTGGGIQACWMFAEPIEHTPESAAAVKARAQAIERRYGSDAMHSLQHYFRLPFTCNWLDAKKARQGRRPMPTQLLHVNWSNLYTLDELAALHGPEEAPRVAVAATTPALDYPAVWATESLPERLPDRLQAIVAEMRLRPGTSEKLDNPPDKKGDRSDHDFWLACECVRHGVTDPTDVALITFAYSPAKLEEKDANGRGEAYAAATVRRALDAVPTAERWFEKIDTSDVANDAGRPAADPSWPDPADVFGDSAEGVTADLPAGCLPSVLEAWSRDEGERLGAPQIFLAASAMTVVASAIGAEVRLQPRAHDTGWTEPCYLWTAIVEEPGGKKSPVMSKALDPLVALEALHRDLDLTARRQWEGLAKARSKAGAAPGPVPRVRRYVVNDFTMEALSGVLGDNPRGVIIGSDELAGTIGALDSYKSNKGADRPKMLQLFTGGTLTVDRVRNGVTAVPNWGASILGGIQPKKIAEMANGLDADGMLQRFLPVMGDGVRRPEIDRLPDAQARADYFALMQGLASARYGTPKVVRLAPGARKHWDAMCATIDNLRDLPGVSDAWRGHLAKWKGIFARLLLAFHAAEGWDLLGAAWADVTVSERTGGKALTYAKVLLVHAMRFYEGCVGMGEAGELARWVAGYILTHSDAVKITRRDLYRAKHSLQGDAGVRLLNGAMRHLELAGWCKPEKIGREGPEHWTVNPNVHTRFVDRARAAARKWAENRARADAAFVERTSLLSWNPV